MSRFANIGERLAADLPKTDPTRPEDDEDELQPESKKKDKDMTTITQEAHEAALATARAEAKAEGVKEANARTEAVMASEHYAGRETLVKTLLATDLSVDQITASLAAAPKVEASSLLTADELKAAAEEAGRKEMKDAIGQNKNSAVEPGSEGASGDGKMSAQAIDAIWDKAVSRVSPAPTK